MAEPIKLGGDSGSTGTSPQIVIGAPTAPTPVTPAPAGESMGNIFTQGQAKKEDSKLISSIISQKDVAQKTKSILGPAPTLEKSIEQDKEATMKRKLRLYQFIFVMIFLATGAMSFYFYSELSPDFSLLGANTTQRLTDTNTNLRQVQTLVSKDRYLAAQLKLNEFSYQSDRFLSSVSKVNDASINSFDKRAIFADLEESQKSLPVLLGEIRDLLTKDLVAPTYRTEKEPETTPEQALQTAQDDLRTALRTEKGKYNLNTTDPQEILDIKLIDNAVKLVGNNALLGALQKTSADTFQKQLEDYAATPDVQKLKAIQDVIGKVLSSTKSDLATIADIKRNRIEWSTIIGQIKEETLNVDKNFDQPLLYETLGGVVYTGYEFDTNNNKIVLSGTTKTLDGSNFTVMSNLIDQLENSRYFEDVDMRSFTKSKAGTGSSEGYMANFKIDLSLEKAGFSNNNSQINLQTDALKGSAPAGAKRTGGTASSASGATSTQQSAVAPSAAAPSPVPAVSATQQTGTVSAPVSTSASGSAPVSASAPALPSAASSSQQTT
ncbi:MAG: hypothetical protein U0519_00530 [Candidatus Gracilibacteria bacterium]